MVATEDVQRQEAITVVVAVEEASELVAMQGIVGGIEVQDEACGRRRVLLQEGIHEELLQAVHVADNLLVAAVGVGADGRQFEAVESTLAGQRLATIAGSKAVVAGGIGLADQDGEQRIEAESVVVVEVFVAQAQAEDTLAEELGQGVFDELGVAIVGEAACEGVEEAEGVIDFAEEQAARVRGDDAAIKGGDDLAGSEVLEIEAEGVTVCAHGAVLAMGCNRR
jgi:hypothetical protein